MSIDQDVSAVVSDIRHYFLSDTEHRPSEEMIESLSYIPRIIEEMRTGQADPVAYVCPLDTGAGKSVTLGFSARRLLARYDVGMLICVSRYDEIADMVERMQLAEDQYAVVVTDGRPERKWGLKYQDRDKAPVLFTTHANIEYHIKNVDSWADLRQFYYKGQPRRIRVWDEAFQPGLTLIVSMRELLLLAGHFSDSPFFVSLFEIIDRLKGCKDRDIISIPDFIYDFGENELRARLSLAAREELGEALHRLFRLSGRLVVVRKDGADANANTIVQYDVTFPDDFYPLLVLDASARVSEFYNLYGAAQGKVRKLPAAPKQYDNVRIFYEEKGSGKETFGKRYVDNLRQVEEVIKRYKADAKALVLHHKEDARRKIGNVEKDLSMILHQPRGVAANVPEVPETHFCSWGRHNATNRYRDCNVIITASTLYPPNSLVEARGRMAAGLGEGDKLGFERERAIRKGEILSNLLQGLSRGILRQLEGDQAKPCDVYIKAAKNTGLYHEFPILFPGAKVYDGWGVNAPPLRKNEKLSNQQERVLLFLEDMFSNGHWRVLFQEVCKQLKLDKSNFSNRIIGSEAFQNKLKERGYVIVRDSYCKAFGKEDDDRPF